MKQLELLKEVKQKCLERIIEKFGTGPGEEMSDMKLSILDVKEVMYEEINKIAEREFRDSF